MWKVTRELSDDFRVKSEIIDLFVYDSQLTPLPRHLNPFFLMSKKVRRWKWSKMSNPWHFKETLFPIFHDRVPYNILVFVYFLWFSLYSQKFNKFNRRDKTQKKITYSVRGWEFLECRIFLCSLINSWIFVSFMKTIFWRLFLTRLTFKL